MNSGRHHRVRCDAMLSQRTALLLLIIPLLAASACGDPPSDVPAGTPGVVMRDSAGVEIVEHRGPDRELPVHEAVRIGVREGDPDYQFNRIRGMAVEAAGNVWVADGHPSVRQFDENGRLVQTFGGAGRGPGEARRYWEVWPDQETVILNGRQDGLQHFDRAGTLIRTDHRELMPPGVIRIPLAPSGDRWYVRDDEVLTDAEGGLRERWTVRLGTFGGAGFDSLRTFVGRPMFLATLETGATGTTFGSFFDGVPALVAGTDGTLVYSHALTYRVEVYSPDGVLRRVLRREVEAGAYTEEIAARIEPAVRAALRELYAAGIPPNFEHEVGQITAGASPRAIPESLPVLDGVLLAADGSLWVERADRHPQPAIRSVAQALGRPRPLWQDSWHAPRRFDLFAPDGDYRGSAEVPSEFVPMAATGTRLYGLATDDYQVQYVVAFEVVAGEGATATGRAGSGG